MRKKIRNAILRVNAPVLVYIKCAVAIEVLEVKAILLDEFILGLCRQFHLFAICFHIEKAISAFLDCAFLRKRRCRA